ncbi:MAG: GDYXXLXY domain-containing protein [Saprospiraceae bacterium]|nr:GDYXXLXY domain-containing protein [Saprospiraceae bacterium]
MISKKFALAGFLILCVIQLYVAASMIGKNEAIINTGRAFKFRTAPVDPNDPFRGKYIVLSFSDTDLAVTDASLWNYGDMAYATFNEDSTGYARIDKIDRQIPLVVDYLEVKISSIINTPEEQRVYVDFPFDRLYLEEKKAPQAEQIYRDAMGDNQASAYALVYIRDGRGVLTDVFVDGKSLSGR